MRRLLLFLSLLMILAPAGSFAEKPFDVDEYLSIDELAAAIVSRVPAAQKPVGSSTKKIRMAVVPVRAGKSRVVSGLTRRLGATERFFVLDPAATTAFVREKKQAGSAMVAEMMRTFGLDAVVAVREYPSDGKPLVLARIFFGEDGRQSDTLVALLALPGVEAAGEKTPAQEQGRWVSAPDLPIAARYVATADLDADGAAEYVFSDGERLHVYRIESAGWRKVWAEERGGIKGGGKHLALDVADVNGNNRPEIFVTVMDGGKVSSSVFEAQGETFQRIAEIPGFLRVLSYPERGVVLIGQEYSENRFYAGTPLEYAWSGSGYAAGAEFPLPKDVAPYGLAAADFGESSPLLVALDAKDRLRVYSRGTLVWESQEKYGATETTAVESTGDIYNVRQKVTIKGRIAVVDLDGDGKEDVLVPRNIGASVFTAANEAEIHGLAWTGARLERTLRIKGLPGRILDFQALQTAAGMQIIVLVDINGGMFSKPATRLMTYTMM